ncbi:MAG: hypothetical protein ACKVP3_11930 [Hyphomicrobiaceae bacterium]
MAADASFGDATLAEVPEAAAAGRIADIYAELRRLTGAPVVALIFRHLATHPGLLEQIWESLASPMQSGVFQEAAWKITSESVPADLIPPISGDVRESVGLPRETPQGLLNAIEAYNRVNPVNLAVMLSLLRRLELGNAAATSITSRTWSPPAPISGVLSTMVRPADIPPHLRRVISDLGFGDRDKVGTVVPSLMRHFAIEPGLLGLLHVILTPKLRDGSLKRTTDAFHARMRHAAEELAPRLRSMPLLAALPGPADTIKTFASTWIPMMTIVGTALRRSLIS